MNILDAFNDIEKLEIKLAELYLYFHKLFSDDPEAAAMFEKLSNEEKSDYALVQYQRKIVRQNQKYFKGVEVDIQEMRAITSSAESIIKRVPSPLLHETIQIATDIESSASEVHYRAAMRQSNKEVADLLKHLGISDKEHFDTLRKFTANRGF